VQQQTKSNLQKTLDPGFCHTPMNGTIGSHKINIQNNSGII